MNNPIEVKPDIMNIYCSSCASDHNLPKRRNQGYKMCMICGGVKPCYAATNKEIQEHRLYVMGRKVA